MHGGCSSNRGADLQGRGSRDHHERVHGIADAPDQQQCRHGNDICIILIVAGPAVARKSRPPPPFTYHAPCALAIPLRPHVLARPHEEWYIPNGEGFTGFVAFRMQITGTGPARAGPVAKEKPR